MSSLTQEARERKSGLRGLLKLVVAIRSALGILERLLRRLINRKRDLPTMADLDKIIKATQAVDDKVSSAVKGLDTLRNIFQF